MIEYRYPEEKAAPQRKPETAQCGTGETTSIVEYSSYAGITRIRFKGHGRPYALISAGLASSTPAIRFVLRLF